MVIIIMNAKVQKRISGIFCNHRHLLLQTSSEAEAVMPDKPVIGGERLVAGEEKIALER